MQLLQAWLEEFEALYERFLNQGFPEILEEWKGYTVTLGRAVTVRQGPKEISGLAVDVAPDGALLLKTASGEMIRVTSGEITPGSGAEPGV